MHTDPVWSDIALRLLLAALAGAAFGMNREAKGHAAGLRTTLLVCLAAALAMLLADVLMTTTRRPDHGVISMDVMRLPLGILTGVGFIGGGVIFMRRDTVRGLTTAASVWLTAALGMAAGAGMIVIAIFTTICYLVVMLLTHKFVSRIMRKRVQDGVIVVRGDDEASLSGRVHDVIQRAGYEVLHVRQDRNNNKNYLALSFLLRGRSDYAVLINHLMQVSGVRTAWSEEPSKRWV